MKKILFIFLLTTTLINAQQLKQYGLKGNVKIATEILYNATYDSILKQYVKQDTIQKTTYYFNTKGLLTYHTQKLYRNNSSHTQMYLTYNYTNGILNTITAKEKPREITNNNPIVSVGKVTYPSKNKQVTFVTNKQDTLLNSKSIITLKDGLLQKLEMQSIDSAMHFNFSYSYTHDNNGDVIKTTDNIIQTTSNTKHLKYDAHKNSILYINTNSNSPNNYELKERIIKYY